MHNQFLPFASPAVCSLQRPAYLSLPKWLALLQVQDIQAVTEVDTHRDRYADDLQTHKYTYIHTGILEEEKLELVPEEDVAEAVMFA